MSLYEIKDNVIIVKKENFDPYATLFSGQVFRVKQLSKDKYFLSANDKACILIVEGERTKIYSNDPDYFANFFDLNRDYKKILSGEYDGFCFDAIGFSPALKVMKQDKFETIIDFIMSANNNIKRFSATLNKIAEKYGEEKYFMGEKYYTFPTPERLANADIADLKSFGCGYRDKYILETSKMIADGFDLNLSNMTTIEANKHLCKLLGVGEKVADCILLFAFDKYDAFPVDTWIEKVYKENYNGKETNRHKIRSFFVDTFGEYAGIIQQYLFFYKKSK